MRWRVAMVVALAVLSGCGGSLDQEPTQTVTPVEVPTVGPHEYHYPDGLDRGGITSVAELIEGHAAALERRSYVWEVNECRRYVENGSVLDEECGMDRITFGNETTYRWIHRAGPDDDPPTSKDTYANGSVIFRRLVVGGQPQYVGERIDGDQKEFDFSAKRILQLYLTVNESSVERVEREGETAYRVVGTDHRVPGYSHADDYRVVALVNPDGMIYELQASYSRRHGNGTSRTTVQMTYSDVGNATVDTPSWIEAARENVSFDE